MRTAKIASAALLAAATLWTAAPATAQVSSLDEVLRAIRADAAETERVNREREAEFRANAQRQTALLNEARGELNQLNARARQVENQFAANEGTIDELRGELQSAQGEFGDVFGAARRSAGEFRAMLENSLITSQYPGRTEVLAEVNTSESLPEPDQLNAIFETMLQEMEAQRQVATYTAAVANVDDGARQEVTRVGPFTVFTADEGDFLEYNAPTGETAGGPLLARLPSQPGDGSILEAADRVTNASAGEVVFAPIDPTRGALLASFERVPTVVERLGNPFTFQQGQGGVIGLIIQWLLIIGVIFGIFNIIRLLLLSASVRSQTRKAAPGARNPLGRIMMAYDENRNLPTETVELKMDEAILAESPKLELGLNFLKLGAAIAPLLGLLGTVTGMIQTFQAMMIYGTGDPQLMAGGISEALVTTMLGLIAAIPLLILHSFCASIARGIQNTLEEQSAGIVARHVEAVPVGGVSGTAGVNTAIT